MPRDIELRVAPGSSADAETLARLAESALGVPAGTVTGVTVLRRSIDARRRGAPRFVLRVRAFVDEEPYAEASYELCARDVNRAEPVIIVGSGPAGLFAALELIERGLKPIVIERGRDVRGRRHDVAHLCREGVVDPESNYCFGEGGAGTFSDGKLYTRSTKRGDVRRVLGLLVQHGAPRDILIDAHPHVGTNRLPAVVQALRATILDCGGEVHFAARMDDLAMEGGSITGAILADGTRLVARALLLATGHSARDVIALLRRRGLRIERKPFALGVRVEHPQALINAIQYHVPARPEGLPAAAYSLVEQVGERGVFSFCMCPGGIVCPAATSPGEIVVNGWSPSSRSSRWASAGIVAEVLPSDLRVHGDEGELAGVALQLEIEHRAFCAGGGRTIAPAQRLVDFCAGRSSADLPPCSYRPAVAAADLAAVLPEPVAAALREALRRFGTRLAGYATNDAVVIAAESRTSSPVRVPRDAATLMHPQASGLFPCGEGAGYAGGIASAALDGIRSAAAIARYLDRA